MMKLPFGAALDRSARFRNKDQGFRIIYVGNICQRKGVHYLLEAVAASGLPPLELRLIGSVDPDPRPLLAKYQDRVRHLGVVARSELYKFYSQSSVFVVASIEEGLALVQGQAMACGVLVVATTNTGAEDLFSDGVEEFIIPIRNPEAIREKS